MLNAVSKNQSKSALFVLLTLLFSSCSVFQGDSPDSLVFEIGTRRIEWNAKNKPPGFTLPG